MIETQSAAGLSEPQPEAMVSAEGFRVRRWLGVGLLALLGVLLAILWAQWPSQVARSRMQEAERRMTAIGKAVLNYAQVHGTLPQSAQPLVAGGPPQSWRTTILSELGAPMRRVTLELSQPWDSPANLEVARRAAADSNWIWHLPFDSSPADRTSFVLVTGPNTVFDGQRARRIREARRGMLKTAIAIEVRDSDIAWHEPRDVTIDEAVREVRERPAHAEGSHVLLIDGVVKFLKSNTDEDVIRYLFDQQAPMPVRRTDMDGNVIEEERPE